MLTTILDFLKEHLSIALIIVSIPFFYMGVGGQFKLPFAFTQRVHRAGAGLAGAIFLIIGCLVYFGVFPIDPKPSDPQGYVEFELDCDGGEKVETVYKHIRKSLDLKKSWNFNDPNRRHDRRYWADEEINRPDTFKERGNCGPSVVGERMEHLDRMVLLCPKERPILRGFSHQKCRDKGVQAMAVCCKLIPENKVQK